LSRKKLNLLKNLKERAIASESPLLGLWGESLGKRRRRVGASDFLPMEPFLEKFLDKEKGV
jgi:hypothetical protein